MLSFAITAADGRVERLPLAVTRLVIAGWTGRDKAKLQEHIDELQALGVAPPVSTPIYYPLSASLLTQDDAIQVLGAGSSGEVEAMLIGTPRGMLVTLASDHTDREAEAYSIQISKQMCQKPVARAAWWFADVAERWDSLTLQSRQDGAVYQDGDCTAMLPPLEIVRGACGAEELPPGWAMPLGTLPVHGGIRGGDRFAMTLADPKTGRTIEHAYRVERLEMAG
ncbi:MAG: DUF2848 family protein [Alphaproteobacteria bacterium]|nr:DUF2848 family protein [Alphaproteobacteria bacterium]MCB9929407.1 DUF2848 family protein [Alphaproteobacteria bacterium]